MECGDTPHLLYPYGYKYGYGYGVMGLHGVWEYSTLCYIHMDTNVDMDMEMGLHGVWQHSALHNIHMDTDMDMDTEYGSTWSVETLYIP